MRGIGIYIPHTLSVSGITCDGHIMSMFGYQVNWLVITHSLWTVYIVILLLIFKVATLGFHLLKLMIAPLCGDFNHPDSDKFV